MKADHDWRELRSKAREAEKKRDFAKAEALYRQALDTDEPAGIPRVQILLALGDCYELQGRVEDAQILYKQARVVLDKFT
jgi:tetratricopeptide (TPR) repeat protein